MTDFVSGMAFGALLVLWPQVPKMGRRALQMCLRSCARSVTKVVLPLADKLDESMREGIEDIYPHVPVAPSPSWELEEIEFLEALARESVRENAVQQGDQDESSGRDSESASVEENGTADDNSATAEQSGL